MPGAKRISTQYCFLRHNEQLRDIIKLKMTQRKLTIAMVAKALKKDRSMVRRYVLGSTPKSLTQIDVLNLAYILGIEIDLTFKVNEEDFTVSPGMLGEQEK